MQQDGSQIGERKRKAGQIDTCPYLDTIQRSFLDFDREPACAISLQAGPHVYACLVCGKFFRGRGRQTPAYTHAVEEGHFVFLHLSRGSFHCLPDDYEIDDASVADIRAALHPTYSPPDIAKLDSNTDLSRDLFGRRYLPGFVGMNNHNKTDCINAVVQALAHVTPIRDFFLAQSPGMDETKAVKKNHTSIRSAIQVTNAFGELVRKIWSNQRFKSTVDPDILVQAISVASKKRFRVGNQAEAGELMAWLLHQLHLGVGGGKKAGSSIIHKTFQGAVRMTVKEAKKVPAATQSEDDDDRLGSGDEEEAENEDEKEEKVVVEETTKDTNFLQLTLDIPEKPLFRDEAGGLVIPQEPLINVLAKFDGKTFSDSVSRSGTTQKKRYRLLRLSDYLILHLDRFKSNNYNREKNPTIVAFPVKNLDLHEYVFPDGGRPVLPTESEIRAMSVKDIKKTLKKFGAQDLSKNVVEKEDLVQAAVSYLTKELPDLLSNKYDLVANITHENPAEVGREEKVDPLQQGSYKCHVLHRATNQWYEIQDLHVQEIMPQQIGVSESYVLIFRRSHS